MSQIELGHAMVTMVEPHRETLEDYNRWYEHDHAYAAVTASPGCFAYRRFVATADLRDKAEPAGTDVGAFIAVYWIERGRDREQFDWTMARSPELVESGRMHPGREHVSTAQYDFVGAKSAEVPPEIALDHPYTGLTAAWIRRDGDLEALAAELRADDTVDVVDLVQNDEVFPAITGSANELLRLYFHKDDPRQGWANPLPDVDGVVRVVPFVPTIPGTDTYLDEL